MKKRSYKLSLPRWALAQRESWYAELAARGLRVQKAGAMLTRFAPAPPARLRYRFEVGSDEGGLPAGQKEFYEECGWQYVLNDRPLHLFCAPEQTDAPDPVSYTHLRAHETGRNLVCRLLLEKKKKKLTQLESLYAHYTTNNPTKHEDSDIWLTPHND